MSAALAQGYKENDFFMLDRQGLVFFSMMYDCMT